MHRRLWIWLTALAGIPTYSTCPVLANGSVYSVKSTREADFLAQDFTATHAKASAFLTYDYSTVDNRYLSRTELIEGLPDARLKTFKCSLLRTSFEESLPYPSTKLVKFPGFHLRFFCLCALANRCMMQLLYNAVKWVLRLHNEEVLELRSQVHQFIRLFGVLHPTQTPCGFNLSLSQVLALQTIEEERTPSLHALAEKLYLERSTVSRLVDALVQAGFIRREVNEENRREILLSLTDHGKRTVEEVRNQSMTFFLNILDNVSEQDRSMILYGFRNFTSALHETRRNQ